MVNGPARARGHSLTELLAIFGVVAILAGAAVPAFSGLLLDSRMNAAVTSAVHAVNFARQLSAARSETIRLCGSDDERACSGREDWSAALLVVNEAESLRRSLHLPGGSGAPHLRSNRGTLLFEGGSSFASPATLTICDRRGTRAARAVIISRTGRPRVSARDASGRLLTC